MLGHVNASVLIYDSRFRIKSPSNALFADRLSCHAAPCNDRMQAKIQAGSARCTACCSLLLLCLLLVLRSFSGRKALEAIEALTPQSRLRRWLRKKACRSSTSSFALDSWINFTAASWLRRHGFINTRNDRKHASVRSKTKDLRFCLCVAAEHFIA